MTRKLRVINTGKRTRYRLGVGFEPNKEVEIEVSNREYLTVKAVRDFEVEEITDDNQDDNATDTEDNGDQDSKDKYTMSESEYQGLTIEEVLNCIEDGIITVEEALEFEKQGKNRSTLIEQLEDKLKEQGE